MFVVVCLWSCSRLCVLDCVRGLSVCVLCLCISIVVVFCWLCVVYCVFVVMLCAEVRYCPVRPGACCCEVRGGGEGEGEGEGGENYMIDYM